MTFRRDMILGGRYRLTDRIAGGGMGEVWAATDQVLRRSVAVKLLRPELLDEPGFLDRFRAEARHTAALAHSGIAGIFDYGEDHHVAYLVMELVNGEPLSAVLARDGALPVATVLSILAQTSAALGAAHRAGVVHRDVKPGNLLVTPDGVVKITDFGISKVIDSVPLTATGQVLGTPQYISPEQATGSSATAASDLYSLGVIGYEMLVGRRPFVGDTPLALAMAHVHEAPPPLPASVPRDLAAAISSMLAKDPSGRPTDAALLATRFESMRAPAVGAAPLAAPPAISPPQVASSSQPTVLHTALGPSASVSPSRDDPATMLAPAQLVQSFRSAAPADDDVSVAPLLQRQHRRPPAVLIAFALILLVTVVAVLATRGGDDSSLTDAAATSVAPVATETTETAVTEATVVEPTAAPPTAAPSTAAQPTAAPTTTIVTIATIATIDPSLYIGLNKDVATSLLKDLGFEVDERLEKKSNVDKDIVVDLEIRPGGAAAGRVTLIVSDGKGRGNERG